MTTLLLVRTDSSAARLSKNLDTSSNSDDAKYIDKQVRKRWKSPRTGSVRYFIHAAKFKPTSHVLCSNILLKRAIRSKAEGKTTLIALVDNFADCGTWPPRSTLTYGRVWMKSKLYVFVVASFAAYSSRYNFVERVHSLTTNKIVPTRLSDVLPGESKPPCKQRLSKPELREKEMKVLLYVCSRISLTVLLAFRLYLFDIALDRIHSILDNILLKGHDALGCTTIRCGDTMEPYDDNEDISKFFFFLNFFQLFLSFYVFFLFSFPN